MSVRHTVTGLDPELSYTIICHGELIAVGLQPRPDGILVFEAPFSTGIRITEETGVSGIQEPPIGAPETPVPRGSSLHRLGGIVMKWLDQLSGQVQRHRWILALLVFCTVFLFLIFLASLAFGAGARTAKLVYYTSSTNTQTAASLDSLCRADLLVSSERPEMVRQLRARNPVLKLLWRTMPQYVLPYDGGPAWWLPDTSWNPSRAAMFYAWKNNWYMPDTRGQILNGWDGTHRLLNWTRYCPVDTYRESKGLRAAEWMARMYARKARTWTWDSRITYNGYVWEAYADCLGSYHTLYANADPNRDGVPDPVTKKCSQGGDREPLTLLIRQENTCFRAALRRYVLRPDLRVICNDASNWTGPPGRVDLNGLKLENFFGPDHPWTFWFNGWEGGVGYRWSEARMGTSGPDDLNGWDASIVTCYYSRGRTEAENQRAGRLAIGTALLGDGYVMLSKREQWAWWVPEVDLDLGRPTQDYCTVPFGPGDTLYTRTFERGRVWVNPGPHYLNGVPPRDAKIWTFKPPREARPLRYGWPDQAPGVSLRY
ncbi:MAG: hypothetical protein ACE15D_19265 [Candidatus Eisenbacteria bacterium]